MGFVPARICYLHHDSFRNMPRALEATSFAGFACPLARAVNQVGPWWNLLIIRNVFLGMRRFADLQQNLGVTATTLNRRLSQLCQDEILQRVRYSVHPPRFEYHLTDKGRDLLAVVVTLTVWGKNWLAPEGQAVRAIACESGAEVVPILVDAVSGARLVPGSFRLEAGPAADPALRELLKHSPVLPVEE